MSITPCLWFDGNAKDAALYYCSIFKKAEITAENPIVVSFKLNGLKFIAINGGPMYKFSPATSFMVECENQAEIDHYWEKLGEGGTYSQCGWLNDKFGVTWQIVPKILKELMADPEKAPRVVKAFMGMRKFDIKALLAA
jgi:predicted 3-demethylubiquinone-9 3-methyltransferase (glyoxalase superfamily)